MEKDTEKGKDTTGMGKEGKDTAHSVLPVLALRPLLTPSHQVNLFPMSQEELPNLPTLVHHPPAVRLPDLR
jgi:hypothetical protein